jgi:AraC-like DNA-binding protein
MAVLYDAARLPVADRNEALEDIFHQAGMPIRVTNGGTAEDVSTRLHHWKFGANDLFVAHGSGLRLTRTPAQVRAVAPEVVRVGFQISGAYTLTVDGYDEAKGAGQVNFADQTQPCEFTQYGVSANTASFEVSYAQLGFPVDVVRKAGRILPSSPVYALVQGHLAALCRRADALAGDASAGTVGDATLELVRAMISSVGPGDDLRTNNVMNETLCMRIDAFIHNNLTDPGLSPERIAQEHYISVRQLYKLWAHRELSLSEWIMNERLEGARRAIAIHASAITPIGTIARQWGFTNLTHFSRRFRGAYGLSPRDWRRLNVS